MKIFKILILFVVVLSANSKAQQRKVLSVGDSLPDFLIPKIINGGPKQLSSAHFKGKLVIIDFWGTSCGSCLAAMPHMDSLQKKFKSKILILPVTNEKEDYVSTFWKNNKWTKNLALTSVVEDKVLEEYFPHRSVPHEVWIYNNKIVGITNSEYVDEVNIKKILDGQYVKFRLKYDFYKFDPSIPLFKFDTIGVDSNRSHVQYAIISNFRNKVNIDVGDGIFRDSLKKTIRVYFINRPILKVYLKCWNVVSGVKKIAPTLGYQRNQVIWEVMSSSNYFYEKDRGQGYYDEWLIDHSICFEALYPDTGQTDIELYKEVISNLDRMLNLSVRWEKRKENVLVIRKKSDVAYKKTQKSTSGVRYTLPYLTFLLNQQTDNPYIFNDSGDDDTEVSLNIRSWTDLQYVKKSIEEQGFELDSEERAVDRLIFTEVRK